MRVTHSKATVVEPNMTKNLMTSWMKCLAVLAVVSACGPAVFGNGKVVTQTKELPVFTKVTVGGGIQLTTSVGELSVLTISGEDNILAEHDISVVQGVLIMKPKPGSMLQPTKPIVADIRVPKLEAINASGASKVVTGVLTSDTAVELEASGASDIQTGLITAPDVNVQGSGSSDVTTSGITTTAKFEVSGASKVTATGLAAEVIDISISGSSHLKARASKEARGSASGASDVTIEGSPAVRHVESSGASDVVFP